MFLFALVYTAGTVSGMYGRGFGFLTFAILLVILIAECVATKGSFSGVRRIVVLLILISSAVFATAQFRYTSVEENRDSYMQYMTDEKSVIVWGKIYKTEYKYFSYRYYMTDCVVQPGYGKAFGRKISCGDVVVYCDSKSAHLGDYMKANGKIGLFKSATNEGEFDRARFYRSQGIDFSVNADSIRTSTGKHAWYYHRLEKLRDTLSASLLEVTDETTAGVLSSMLLGDKSYLDDEIKDLYQVSGISHILAISGLHISIVGMAFYKLLTKLCCYDRKCRVHKACRGDVHTYNACGSFRQMHRYAQFSWHHGHLPAVGQSYGFGICRICVLGRGNTCYRYCDACDECS